MEEPLSPSGRKFRWRRRDPTDISVGSDGPRRQNRRSLGNFRRSRAASCDDSEIRSRTRSPLALRFRRHTANEFDLDSYGSGVRGTGKKSILKKINPFRKSGRKKSDADGDEFDGEYDSDWGGSNHTPNEPSGRRGRNRGRNTASSDHDDDDIPNYSRPEMIEFSSDPAKRAVSFEDPVNDTEDLGYETMTGFTDEQPAEATGTEMTRASYGDASAAQKKKHRVRPYHCFDPPVYQTEEDIYADSTEPSVTFEHLQSFLAPSKDPRQKIIVPESVSTLYGSPETDGRIGAIRIEVLGCISLNRTKPDVAAYIVCGDSAFSTDVLQNYRSPMWPSASKRAAVFPIHHAFARMYVGIFDVNARTNKENDVFCGRVAIDVCSLRPETEYDSTMPLRASNVVYDRRKRGVVRLRFSLYWFSERAAVLSYFWQPKSLVESCPLVGGYPVIPCAEPKTFRNVAVTVHGQDLPGKYSKGAFRATMREFNLYQTNLRYLVKTMVLDVVLYEYPLVSLYLFFGGMHCVLSASMRWVPPYAVSYVIILLYRNYCHYVESEAHNYGYKPVSLSEVFRALINDGQEPKFESISVTKRAKNRKGKGKTQLKLSRMDAMCESEEKSIEPMDHHEFPFSDREAYPKLEVEKALAQTSKKALEKGATTRLHGRLSVYYTSAPPSGVDAEQDHDDSSEGDHSFGDDETMMTESGMDDNLFPLDMDGDEDDDIMDEPAVNVTFAGPTSGKSSSSIFEQGISSATRRLKIGPTQNADKSSNSKVPPQIHLKKTENILHKFSKRISVERVAAPVQVLDENRRGLARRTSLALNTEDLQAQAKEKKKATYDEFDKLLGMERRSANPVLRIMSTFLGPLMRIIRIFIFIFRASYNIASWRDPFLTFWVFCALCVLCFILIIFPWRQFFFISTIVCLGPQNVLVRIHLEKKAAKRGKENQSTPPESETADPASTRNRTSSVDSQSINSSMHSTDGNTRASRRKIKRTRKKDRNDTEAGGMRTVRPPFSASSGGTKRYIPRSVAIPYSRLMKERFYDWPPDPTVSRATTIETAKVKEKKRRANLFSSSHPGDNPAPVDEIHPAGIRKRR